MDKDELKKSITIDEMKTLLIELGVQHIEDNSHKGHLITNTICHNISDGKMKLYYYLESQEFHCYTACGDSFDIYELVIRNNKLKGIELTFPQSVGWVGEKLGRKINSFQKPEGFRIEAKVNEELEFMNKFKKKKTVELKLQTYDDSILEMFSDYHHPAFLEDNISHEAMDKFEIKYYSYRHKIIIPHRKWDTGEIIGIKTRALDEEEIDKGYKYIPLKLGDTSYAYPTYQNLYGLWQNKEAIKRMGKCIIFESEKSCLQVDGYYNGFNFSVALCGSNMSIQQSEMILRLKPREVCIALDKEYETATSEKGIAYQQKLLKLGKLFTPYVKTTVIFDTDNLLDLKDSPSDKGKDVFEQLYQKRQEIRLKDEL